MHELAILTPVLRRPQLVRPLLDSIAATIRDAPVRVVFIADPNDHGEHTAVHHAQAGHRHDFCVDLMVYGGTYPEKVNAAVRNTTEPLLFLGADDLQYRVGWYEAAKRRLDEGAEIVGINDLIPRRPGREGHATHFLMTRNYALQPTIDGGAGPLSVKYEHNFCDDELIGTAKKRGVYAYAADAHVKHNHPMIGAANDSTYDRGQESWFRDRRTYRKRVKLWT